jgi:two-component system OmpR family sensor kinase
VTDTGPGIAPEYRDQLFRPYYQITDRPPSGVPKGCGMGLAIARAIARVHQGRVELVSSEGAGCRFQLTLPL